jgi:hypothetical protein
MTARNVARVVMVMALSFGACSWWSGKNAKTWPMNRLAKVPAAQGTVVTHEWEGRERKVEVKVKHLAPAHQVVTGANYYVVWFKSMQENAPAQNVGILDLNSELEGTRTASTAFVDFDVLVRRPSVRSVPWTSPFRRG